MQELPPVYYLMLNLRDDFCDGKIFDGMIRRGENELPKRSVGISLENCGNSVVQAKREQSDRFSGEASKRKKLLATAT